MSQSSRTAAGREWNAASYGRLTLPHERWGRRTLDRLALRGGETVLELGCGTGRDAELALDQLPDGRLIALDGSSAMVDATRDRCADAVAAGRLTTFVHDLTKPLPLPDDSVDAVFSVATLHWLAPEAHPLVFRELARVVRPGGRITLEYGGQGNIAEVSDALRAVGVDPDGHAFADPEAERAALVAAGFADVEAGLRPEPPFHPGDQTEEFLGTIILRGYLARLPEPERDGFVRSIAERLPDGVTYVRMEVAGRVP